MRVLALMFILGCSGTTKPKDPFAAGTCDSHWTENGFTTCDEGCADAAQVLGAMGSACDGMLETGSAFHCIASFDFGSANGCCASDKPNLYFAECP